MTTLTSVVISRPKVTGLVHSMCRMLSMISTTSIKRRRLASRLTWPRSMLHGCKAIWLVSIFSSEACKVNIWMRPRLTLRTFPQMQHWQIQSPPWSYFRRQFGVRPRSLTQLYGSWIRPLTLWSVIDWVQPIKLYKSDQIWTILHR